jgi:glycosyltransferase involved in cell wall biosynthesis
MTMPRISVLMPVYNGMPYVREAIDSVRTQSCQDWELVISDNGSVDGTADYVRSVQDSRIRFYQQTDNLGVYGNLNFLIAHAESPIAKILCADDTLLSGALEKIAAFMEERPQCAVSRCWVVGDEKKYSTAGRHKIVSTLPIRLEPKAAVLTFATCGNLVGNLSQAACRPQLVIQAGGFNVEFPYAGDWEGWLRVINQSGLDLQNEELVYERTHPNQFRNLLNKQYESIPQLNQTINLLAGFVKPVDIPLLKRHWTIHFLSPRLSPFLRDIIAGRPRMALKLWRDLPLGISPLACIVAYPLWKLNLTPARATANELFKRISELNGGQA